jgi:hypothetical protein
VALGIDRGGELGPGGVLGSRPAGEVSGRVSAVQAGGIDGDGRGVGDQVALGCGRGGAGEEDDGLPFFRIRASA